jgi:hypothetical protein
MNRLDTKYISDVLFPLFANRLLTKSRPEYDKYLSWMGFQQGRIDPLELLARSGGERATDSLQVYPCPEKTPEGKYETYFFCHGMRHLRGNVPQEILKLAPGEMLLPMLDVFNPYDSQAVALRTSDPAMMIGFCPRYLARDLRDLILHSKDTFCLLVERVNVDAPIQFRLLCKVTADWPEGFKPCSEAAFQPVVSDSGEEKEAILGR